MTSTIQGKHGNLSVVFVAYLLSSHHALADPPTRDSQFSGRGKSEAADYAVTTPPASLKLPAFYKKYASASGFPVVSSESVNDYALKEAAWLVDKMLQFRPDLRKAMIDGGSRVVVMAHSEFTTDVPEHARLKPADYWDRRARGLGGSRFKPVCSCGEENLLAFQGDPYASENILIHEFAHTIHLSGLARVDPTFDQRLQLAFESAKRDGLWTGTYAGKNRREYFAEGVQSWFNTNRPPDHDHNDVDTREELRAYDPLLSRLCEEVFGDNGFRYTHPTTRLVGHLQGYDPSSAPRFVWPEHLKGGSRRRPKN